LTGHLRTECFLHARQPGSVYDESPEVTGWLLTAGGEDDVDVGMCGVAMLASDPRWHVGAASVGGELGHG
jgi:hypothetical protein